ncbi:MAG: hypothetical protein WCK73_04235 [Deltaproteobacteria bacterium]
MRRTKFWIGWLVCNLAWFFGAPILLGLLLEAVGTKSEGDSPKILVAGFVLFNGAILLLVNVTWGVVAVIRRRRRKGTART